MKPVFLIELVEDSVWGRWVDSRGKRVRYVEQAMHFDNYEQAEAALLAFDVANASVKKVFVKTA